MPTNRTPPHTLTIIHGVTVDEADAIGAARVVGCVRVDVEVEVEVKDVVVCVVNVDKETVFVVVDTMVLEVDVADAVDVHVVEKVEVDVVAVEGGGVGLAMASMHAAVTHASLRSHAMRYHNVLPPVLVHWTMVAEASERVRSTGHRVDDDPSCQASTVLGGTTCT